MTDKEDLRGSKCSTLTSDQRACVEATDQQDHIDAQRARVEQDYWWQLAGSTGVTICGQARGDSDDYLARSVGTLFRTIHGPSDREGVKMRLDWCDHGHTTHYFVDGFHVDHSPTLPTVEVSTRAHLESIWSAGRVFVWRYVMAKQREEQSSS